MSAKHHPEIGAHLRQAREEQGLTLEVLAEKSGVTRSMIEQIENEAVYPTLATVWKLTRALGVEIDALLKGGMQPVRRFSITHSEDGPQLETAEDGPLIRVLSPLDMAEILEIYILEFQPGAVLDSEPHAPGTEEFLTLLSGEIEVEVPNRHAHLRAGDFINYSCDLHHTITNTGSEPAQVHMVVRFPERSWS